MPISKPRSSMRLYVLIRVAAVSEPPLDHSGLAALRRAYYFIWHDVVHSVGDRYSDVCAALVQMAVVSHCCTATAYAGSQQKRYRSRTGQNVSRELFSV